MVHFWLLFDNTLIFLEIINSNNYFVEYKKKINYWLGTIIYFQIVLFNILYFIYFIYGYFTYFPRIKLELYGQILAPKETYQKAKINLESYFK